MHQTRGAGGWQGAPSSISPAPSQSPVPHLQPGERRAEPCHAEARLCTLATGPWPSQQGCCVLSPLIPTAGTLGLPLFNVRTAAACMPPEGPRYLGSNPSLHTLKMFGAKIIPFDVVFLSGNCQTEQYNADVSYVLAAPASRGLSNTCEHLKALCRAGDAEQQCQQQPRSSVSLAHISDSSSPPFHSGILNTSRRCVPALAPQQGIPVQMEEIQKERKQLSTLLLTNSHKWRQRGQCCELCSSFRVTLRAAAASLRTSLSAAALWSTA